MTISASMLNTSWRRHIFKLIESISTSELEESIVDYIENTPGMPEPNKVSVMVHDLMDDELLVSYNENIERQLASMVKPLVALGLFTEIHNCKTGKSDRDFVFKDEENYAKLLRDSDNTITDYYMNTLGVEYLNNMLKEQYRDDFKSLSIVGTMQYGKTRKNKASTADIDRFLTGLWHHRFPYSKKLLFYLGLPKQKFTEKNRVSEGTFLVPDSIEKYEKTGTRHQVCGTMAILVPQDKKNQKYPYTLTAIIEEPGQSFSNNDLYLEWMKEMGNHIRKLSDMTYAYMGKKHGFMKSEE